MATIRTEIYGGKAVCTFNEKVHTYHFRVPGVVEKLWQPSVTGILGMKSKPALVNWAAKESLKVVYRHVAEFQSQYGETAVVSASLIEGWLADAVENWREEDKSTTIGTVAHRYAYEELRFRCGLTNTKPKFPIEHDAVLMPDFTPGMLEMANASASQVVKYFDEHHFQPQMMERPLWSPTHGYCGTPDFIGLIDGVRSVADYKTSKKIYAEYWAQLAALQLMYQEEFGVELEQRVAINIPKDGSMLQVETRKMDHRYGEDLAMFFNCQGLYGWNRANDDFSLGDPVRVLGNIFKDTVDLKPVAADDCPW